MAFGVAGAAPATQDFPASTAEADVLRWVKARTSIDRGAILSVGPQAVIAFERKTAVAGTIVSAEVREELIGSDLATRAGARSVRITLELDCDAHRYRILGRTLFALANLQGEGRNQAGSPGWAQVDETAPIGKAWQAVCSTDFVFPYAKSAAPSPPPSASPQLPPPPVKPAAPPRTGAYEVLLGSYSIPANAKGAVDKLTYGYASALGGRRPQISSVEVGGKSYSAVRVGPFATAADASGFCARIKPSGLVCVVKTREPDTAKESKVTRPTKPSQKTPPF
jgi:hypothetical protein